MRRNQRSITRQLRVHNPECVLKAQHATEADGTLLGCMRSTLNVSCDQKQRDGAVISRCAISQLLHERQQAVETGERRRDIMSRVRDENRLGPASGCSPRVTARALRNNPTQEHA